MLMSKTVAVHVCRRCSTCFWAARYSGVPVAQPGIRKRFANLQRPSWCWLGYILYTVHLPFIFTYKPQTFSFTHHEHSIQRLHTMHLPNNAPSICRTNALPKAVFLLQFLSYHLMSYVRYLPITIHIPHHVTIETVSLATHNSVTTLSYKRTGFTGIRSVYTYIEKPLDSYSHKW